MAVKQSLAAKDMTINVSIEGLDEGIAKLKEMEAILTRCIRKQRQLKRLSRRQKLQKPYWLK